VRGVVFLDGEYSDPGFYAGLARGADLVVAADGGARFLLEEGLRPDLVVGDFDSLAAADVERLAADGVEIMRHPVRKDCTDGELAVDEVRRRGADDLLLVGALGALDHTLGHLAILWRLAKAGARARLATPRLAARVLVAPAATALGAPPGTRVSLVSLGGDAVVTLEGLEYSLVRGRLPGDACLGLGNAVTAAARIVVHEGAVAVLVESAGETFPEGG